MRISLDPKTHGFLNLFLCLLGGGLIHTTRSWEKEKEIEKLLLLLWSWMIKNGLVWSSWDFGLGVHRPEGIGMGPIIHCYCSLLLALTAKREDAHACEKLTRLMEDFFLFSFDLVFAQHSWKTTSIQFCLVFIFFHSSACFVITLISLFSFHVVNIYMIINIHMWFVKVNNHTKVMDECMNVYTHM